KLVANIAIFEFDIPKLALFYNWYYEQLESDKSSDITKIVTRFNNRPGNQNNNFELLDPNSDNNESSDDNLIESNNESKSMESSESETELETNSDIDSKH
ncbi:41135_t:CDS:2, partial [Gigaspora margarita]